MEEKEGCQVCRDIRGEPGRYKSATGFVTCKCGFKHKVGVVNMRTRPDPEVVTGRYRIADLSWRSAMPKRGSKVRRGKLFDTCPDFRS